jgi:hypothetical protein
MREISCFLLVDIHFAQKSLHLNLRSRRNVLSISLSELSSLVLIPNCAKITKCHVRKWISLRYECRIWLRNWTVMMRRNLRQSSFLQMQSHRDEPGFHESQPERLPSQSGKCLWPSITPQSIRKRFTQVWSSHFERYRLPMPVALPDWQQHWTRVILLTWIIDTRSLNVKSENGVKWTNLFQKEWKCWQKFFSRANRISATDVTMSDDLLWDFRQNSFRCFSWPFP